MAHRLFPATKAFYSPFAVATEGSAQAEVLVKPPKGREEKVVPQDPKKGSHGHNGTRKVRQRKV